ALASTLRPAECVVCAEGAHIAVDETGAPERVLGAKILTLPTADGKLRPEQLEPLHHLIGAEHHAQPGVLSITQSTESGTLYSADEIGGLSEVAHRMGMRVHLDGARIANATAALGGSIAALRSFTVDAGVDVVSLGGTKAGMAHGEAVVYLDPALAARSRYLRKNVTQLPSKMRFIAAQFTALLDDGLWIDLATHANALARTLYDATRDIPGVEFARAPEVHSVFPVLPPEVIEPLMAWCFFWPWD
ncbi:MAG: threonine aldolase family protein, partial [Gemmatimonadota bacterium]